jgi:hypothetical protein
MIDGSLVFAVRRKVPWRVIDDDAVVVDLPGNSVLQISDVGCHIWERIDGTTPVAAIVDSVVAAYEVDRADAARDAERFFAALIEKGLIHALPSDVEHSGPSL